MRLIDLLHQNSTCAARLKTTPVTFCADDYLILNELLLPQNPGKENIWLIRFFQGNESLWRGALCHLFVFAVARWLAAHVCYFLPFHVSQEAGSALTLHLSQVSLVLGPRRERARSRGWKHKNKSMTVNNHTARCCCRIPLAEEAWHSTQKRWTV